MKIQRRYRHYKLNNRVHRLRIIEVTKTHLCSLFQEKHGQFDQSTLSERRLEIKMQQFANALKKFRQSMDRHGKVFLQETNKYMIENQKIFTVQIKNYMQSMQEIKINQ